MNAHVALLEPQAQPCREELTRINESLQARERLLSASASASRLLLEAPDVRAAIPRVLGIIGEAAHVDRVNVMETRTGPHGEPLLVVVSEWTAPGVTPHLGDATVGSCDERKFAAVCAELRAGRSVCFSKDERSAGHTVSGIEGVGTRTKAIVPIFVAGEFMGVVGFDNTRQHRAIEASELAALETAAGVIGAALHRERLVDDVRREREHAAEERVAELAKANAVIRGNLERLAGATDLHSFMGHMLLEATRQFDAVLRRRDRTQGFPTGMAHRRARARWTAGAADVRNQRTRGRLGVYPALRRTARTDLPSTSHARRPRSGRACWRFIAARAPRAR